MAHPQGQKVPANQNTVDTSKKMQATPMRSHHGNPDHHSINHIAFPSQGVNFARVYQEADVRRNALCRGADRSLH